MSVLEEYILTNKKKCLDNNKLKEEYDIIYYKLKELKSSVLDKEEEKLYDGIVDYNNKVFIELGKRYNYLAIKLNTLILAKFPNLVCHHCDLSPDCPRCQFHKEQSEWFTKNW